LSRGPAKNRSDEARIAPVDGDNSRGEFSIISVKKKFPVKPQDLTRKKVLVLSYGRGSRNTLLLICNVSMGRIITRYIHTFDYELR
jgi:hypothetical protein